MPTDAPTLALRRACGVLVKAARLGAGLDRQGLASRIGLSVSTVSRIETGRLFPSVLHVLLIAVALDVDPGSLIPDLEMAKASHGA